jgi:phage membrane protein
LKKNYYPETGNVYVISNGAYKNNPVKIGRTGKIDADERINELNKETGVPEPFTKHSITSTDCSKIVEKTTHLYLNDNRPNPKKEFFNVPPKEATQVVNSVNEYIHEHTYVEADTYAPCSEEEKKRMRDAGYEPSDYCATFFSKHHFYPDENDVPKGLNQEKWKEAVKKM